MSRVVFVTGAAGGIGRAAVSSFLAAGDFVCAADINDAGIKAIAKKEKWPANQTLIVKLDVRSAKSWKSAMQAVLKKWQRLDVLINNAGYLLPAYVPAVTEEMVDRHFDINAKGVILGTAEAARIMRTQNTGHIINIASLAGVAGIPGISVYSASKHAVRGFTLAAAQELAPAGISVTVICPDAVKTPMLDLQKDFAEAALTFSGSKYLEASDVVAAMHRALAKKPREILVPASRGMLARLASAFPSLSAGVAGIMEKKGKANQTRFRKGS